MVWLRPRAVPRDGVIGVVAPSGPVDPDRLNAGLAALHSVGWRTIVAPGCSARAGYLAGSDDRRAADLAAFLADPAVDAVVAARGGYGAMRVLPYWDLAPLSARPKPLVGFSDITALHLAMARAGLVSFHGPMVEADPEAGPPLENLTGLVRALTDPEPLGDLVLPPGAPPPRAICAGRARGPVVGGNLTLITATLGTPWEIDTRGRLLLLEDTGEAPYRLDRCLTQLWLAGKLQQAAGIVMGELTCCDGEAGDPDPLDVVTERLRPLGRPVLANLPLGHGRHKLTLPLGVAAQLDADAGRLSLLEGALRA